jgi:hypothetical protein
MAYTPQTWADGSSGATPLTAARLNHMEAGIAAGNEPQAVPWAAELRVTDTGTRALGLNGAALGIAIPTGLSLTRVQVRFGTADVSGQTDIQILCNGDDTDMPLLSVEFPGVLQMWTGSVDLAQSDVLTADVVALGGTPGAGLSVLFSGVYL